MNNTLYIVTKASDDGTFELGDHIIFNTDGSISCIEAEGWIDKDDVPKAIKGLEYEIDQEQLEKDISKAEQELESLRKKR